jgi:ionotropic glutamate receptor
MWNCFSFKPGEEVKSRAGRLLTVFWLVAVLIFTSSYTASLSSMLAAQQPSPTIASFVDLQKSHLQVGSQGGSFVFNYMINNLYIVPQRLVTLFSEEDYDQALKSGNVSAIVDESPYLETFLTTYGCRYTNVDADIAYFSGFGFVSILLLCLLPSS